MSERRKHLVDYKAVRGIVSRYKYVCLVIVAGVLLLLLPVSEGKEKTNSLEVANEEDFSVNALEEKLSAILAEIDGAGRVKVMLTVESGMKRIFAQDGTVEQEEDAARREIETVIISSGTGKQETVLVQQIYPRFQGALIVADGGSDPSIRLKLTEAVAALTGLGTDKISVCKGK